MLFKTLRTFKLGGGVILLWGVSPRPPEIICEYLTTDKSIEGIGIVSRPGFCCQLGWLVLEGHLAPLRL